MVDGADNVVVTGSLEMVDLRSHNFRIRDDAGNAIELQDVRDAHVAARLLGTDVTAAGRAVRDRTGLLRAVVGPEVAGEDETVSGLRVSPRMTIAALLDAEPGPAPDGGIDLTDAEFAAFLEATRS